MPASSAAGESGGFPAPVTVARALGRVVVTVEGPLDGRRTPLVARLLEDLVRAKPDVDLTVDVKRAEPVGESTIDALAAMSRHIKDRGGALVIAGAAPDTQAALHARGVRLTRPRRRRGRLANRRLPR